MKPPNSLVLRRVFPLIAHLTILITVLLEISKSLTAYPTGSMSCSDIGDFAAAAVVGKQNGRSMEEALETVRKRTAGYSVERKNLMQIVQAIYTEPWAIHLSEDGARQSFTADCEAQWTAPTGGNTEQNRNSVDTSYQIYVPREEYRKLEELQKEHERLAEDARKAMAHYRSLPKEDKKEATKAAKQTNELPGVTPTPTPKPKQKRGSRKHQTGPAGEPVYRSQPVSPGNSGKGRSSD